MAELIVSEMHAKKAAKKASIVSIPVGYFIASELAFIASILIAIKYDIGWDEQFDQGTWLVLGGFSLWIPTSALILPIMIIIRCYAVVNLKRLTVSTSQSPENSLIFTEKLYLFKKSKTVEIKQNAIRFIKIKRETWDTKYIWIIFISFHLIYMLTDGFTLLTNPHLFGDGIDNALTYTLAGVLDIVIIVFLIFTPQTLIEVHTDDEIYKFVYFAREHNQSLFNKLEEILGMHPSEKDDLWEPFNISRKNRAPRLEFIIGVFFILTAALSKIFQIFAGDPLRSVLYFSGIIFILYSCIYELSASSSPGKIALIRNQTKNWMIYRNSMTFGRSAYLIKNESKSPLKPELQLVKLDIVRIVPIVLTPLITGWTLGAWFRFLPSSPEFAYFGVFSALNIILSLFVLALIMLFAIRVYETYLPPEKWGDEMIQMPRLYLNEHEGMANSKPIGKIRAITSNMNKKLKKQLIIRSGLILGLSLVGLICAYIF
ncbi:hypothetical protein ES708_01615 [subsurface metagenome]